MRDRAYPAPARALIFVVVGIGWLGGPGLASSATKSSASSAKKPFEYDTSGTVNIGADPASVSGPAVLQYQGVTAGTFNPTVVQPINLGQFVVSPSSTTGGQTTTYTDTPFEVQIQTPEFNKSNNVPLLDQIIPSLDKKLDLKSSVENSLLLKGHLDGTVSANGQVNVIATVDSIKLGSIDGQSSSQVIHYAFPIRYNQLTLPSSWVVANSSASVTVPTSTAIPMIPASTTTGTVAPAPAAEMVTIESTSNPAPLPVPAPEPSTILFFAAVLGGLALGRRRLSPR